MQPPTADNFGVQLLLQVSNWLGDVSGELAVAGRTVSDFPMLWRWRVHLAADPGSATCCSIPGWKLALAILCALAAEWIISRAICRPLTAVARYSPVRVRDRAGGGGVA